MSQTTPFYLLLSLNEEILSTFVAESETIGISESSLANLLRMLLLANQSQENSAHVSEELMRLFVSLAAVDADPSRISPLPALHPESRLALVPLRQDLEIDLARGEIHKGATIIRLTGREMRVLGKLMRNPNCYISATTLADGIVSEESIDPGHCIEETIRKLRRKLDDDPANPRLLRCRREIGYGLFPDLPP